METHCVSCKKNTANKDVSVRRINKTRLNKLMLVSNCAIWGKKVH